MLVHWEDVADHSLVKSAENCQNSFARPKKRICVVQGLLHKTKVYMTRMSAHLMECARGQRTKIRFVAHAVSEHGRAAFDELLKRPDMLVIT